MEIMGTTYYDSIIDDMLGVRYGNEINSVYE